MKKILITGSQGFIGSYLCAEFLNQGYRVIGVDNFSKYGPITRPHDNHPNFELIEMDVIDFDTKNILPQLHVCSYISFNTVGNSSIGTCSKTSVTITQSYLVLGGLSLYIG